MTCISRKPEVRGLVGDRVLEEGLVRYDYNHNQAHRAGK